MRIVYVEDNEANASLVERVAHLGAHQFITYHDAESALENFTGDNPDLLIVDIYLAGAMDGLELVRHVRSAGYQTPIFVMTAYATNADRMHYIAMGCNELIVKPASVDQLVELIATV